MWYVIRGFPPLPEVLGIYDDPPPAGAEDYIRSQRVSNIGAVPLLRRATRLRDRIFDAAEGLLS